MSSNLSLPNETEGIETLAAVDLGTNSFHLVIARAVEGQLQIVDRLKEMVRLGGGLDEQGYLSSEVQERALTVLSQFGERLRGIPIGSVRVVGTNTLRKAKNSRKFLHQAQRVIGHPVEVISGREEARLVYLGVARSISGPEEQRLVVDIGGGSTECIIGRKLDALLYESLHMGCVSFTQRFFPKGVIERRTFQRAVVAARQEIQSIALAFRRRGWDLAVGSSGTIKAIDRIATEEGLSSGYQITRKGLAAIRERVLEAGHSDRLAFKGLSDDRKPVFAAGLAILLGVFESFELEAMTASDGALREGLLHELYGRRHAQDVRHRTIEGLASLYQVDSEHAQRVAKTAEHLFRHVQKAWKLDSVEDLQFLIWAAKIHEIGLAVSHSRYHKHGSYLVENSDLPGFSRQDQQVLWALIRSHRRRFKPHRFAGLDKPISRKALRLCVLLRLAVLLNRSRRDEARTEVKASVKGKEIDLSFPEPWLADAPLTVADLEQEAQYLQGAGFDLTFR